MNDSNKKRIKTKILVALVLSIAFTALGIYLFTTKSQTIAAEYEGITKIIGLIGWIFFGLGAAVLLGKIIKQ